MGETLDLLVFVDALGWELAGREGILDDVCRERRPLKTVLGYSCACVPTILTGRSPAEHGHFAFWVRATGRSPFAGLSWLRFLPKALTRRGRVRHLLSGLVKRWLGFTGYFELYNVPFEALPLLDYTEQRDLYRPGGIHSGDTTLLDDLERAGVPVHVSDWRRPDAENLRSLDRALTEGQPRFAFLYLGGLDAVLHRTGTRADEPGQRVAWYDEQLRRALDRASARYGTVRLHVVSDHGMDDVTRTVDVAGTLAHAGLVAWEDHVALLDSTMARFWFVEPESRERVYRALSDLPGGRFLSVEELKTLGCHFDDHRFGEAIWLADAGVCIHPGHMGERPLVGMHGYHPEGRNSWATYLGTHAPPGPLADLRDVRGLVQQSVLGAVTA